MHVHTHDNHNTSLDEELVWGQDEGWAESPGVQVIVESGVGNGGSTRAACAWARAVPGRPPAPPVGSAPVE